MTKVNITKNRISRPGVFCKKGALKIFAKFRGKHLSYSFVFNKVAGISLQLYQKRDFRTGAFCEFCEAFK